jgi:hypothetical protein
MGVDLERKRPFVAALTNNTLEVVDLTAGTAINNQEAMVGRMTTNARTQTVSCVRGRLRSAARSIPPAQPEALLQCHVVLDQLRLAGDPVLLG